MNRETTHRDRVVRALRHQEPDRIPIDLGSTRCTSLNRSAYQHLKAHFDIHDQDFIIDKMQQSVKVDDRILEALDIDTRGVWLGPPDRSRDAQLSPTLWLDEWGVLREQPPGSPYYDLVGDGPLSGEISLQDIMDYPWPDPHDPGRTRGLRERVLALREATDCAIVLNTTSIVVHGAQYLRGFEDWFTDCAGDPMLAGALMDAVLDVHLAILSDALDEVGDLVDVVYAGDDIGHQNGPLVSPDMYRRLIKPRHRRFFDVIKSKSDAMILLHTCGSIYSLLGDLVDIGVDAVNPVQVTAKDMGDTARLKREFGDKLTFWGGVDAHHVLPGGTTEDVRHEVARRIRDLAPGGGYVLNSVHNIQPGVPVENILAMFEYGRLAGRYPLELGDERLAQYP
jgi:uroporphyrinogen decarboxylase